MQVLREIVEILGALLPAVGAVSLTFVQATKSGQWFVKVIGTAVLSVIALGMLLMRLTSSCTPVELGCALPYVSLERAPGLFGVCQSCTTPGEKYWAQLLNQATIHIQAASTGVCVLVSSFTIIRFMLWTKKTLLSKQEKQC